MTHVNISGIALLFILTTSLLTSGCSSNPASGGVSEGTLTACPSSPNCVGSEGNDEDHSFDRLKYQGTPEQAKEKLMSVLNAYPNTKIVLNKENYIQAEFTTSIMRYVDDGEFLIDEEGIQVRSASRIGYSDMGKNRSRMEEIKAAYEPCCN